MTYKLTLDTNLMAAELNVPGMDTLKRWQDEGKIELSEADRAKVDKNPAFGWPGAAPKPQPQMKPKWGSPKGRSGKMAESGNANFSTVAAVLFPSKDPHKLNMTEINNVAHLIKHHSSKNELFLTLNEGVLETARRERLKTSFGIVAMTPEEAVQTLGELEGWTAVGGKKTAKAKKAKEE